VRVRGKSGIVATKQSERRKMKINDLPRGKYTAVLDLRKNGALRLKGEIVEDEDGNKHLITHESPKRSYAPNTVVLWHRKEVKK